MSALYLTGTARAMIEVMRPRLEVVDEIILKPLSRAESAIFMKLLWKLVDINNGLSRAPKELFGHAGTELELTP